MVQPSSRRRFLGTALFSGSVLLAGCMDQLTSNDGDVVVDNEDDDDHDVTVTLDRGSGYDTRTVSVSISAGESGRIRNFISESDWNYPLLLHIELDGEYSTTTKHMGYDDVPLTITSGGEVSSDDEDTVPTTPEDPHGPQSDS